MAAKALPPQDVLRQMLDYDPATGVLTWKERGPEWFSGGERPEVSRKIWNTKNAGNPALNTPHGNGYVVGRILGVKYFAHRVAYKMYYEFDPVDIDHINGNRSDNRIANLRSVTRSENNKNKTISSLNTSGHVGVSFDKYSGKWRAYIWRGNKKFSLGSYDDFPSAITARKSAQDAFGFHSNHGRVL